MIQTVVMAQALYAKAAIVDYPDSRRLSARTISSRPRSCLQDAFATDVRPAIARVASQSKACRWIRSMHSARAATSIASRRAAQARPTGSAVARQPGRCEAFAMSAWRHETCSQQSFHVPIRFRFSCDPALNVAARASQLQKSFAGVSALAGLSFELAAGEVHALVGENGAGKSTWSRSSRRRDADAGSLSIAGALVSLSSPADARACGIAAIYQQPALFPDLSVAENIALPVEPAAPWSARELAGAPRAQRAERCSSGSARRSTSERRVETLSLPEQQLVEIAKALGADARILLMDEPTASLTDREVERLFARHRRRCGRRASASSTSRIGWTRCCAIADRVTVLRDGETVGTQAARARSNRAELIRLMVGRAVAHGVPEASGRAAAEASCSRFAASRSASAGVDATSAVASRAARSSAGRPRRLGPDGAGRDVVRPADRRRRRGPRRGARRRIAFAGRRDRAPGIAYVPEDRRRHGVVLRDVGGREHEPCVARPRVLARASIEPPAERDRRAAYVEPVSHQDASVDDRRSGRCQAAISRRSRWRAGWRRRPRCSSSTSRRRAWTSAARRRFTR